MAARQSDKSKSRPTVPRLSCRTWELEWVTEITAIFRVRRCGPAFLCMTAPLTLCQLALGSSAEAYVWPALLPGEGDSLGWFKQNKSVKSTVSNAIVSFISMGFFSTLQAENIVPFWFNFGVHSDVTYGIAVNINGVGLLVRTMANTLREVLFVRLWTERGRLVSSLGSGWWLTLLELLVSDFS